MNWSNCYSRDRYGIENQASPQRTEFERDWDRLIFSSAFRRLQNKTQVFPLPEEIFVHNRLTHSLEVASVGRSLGSIVGEALSQLPEIQAFPDAISFYRDELKSVIAAACLAHDLGNPAFGHSGESAISRYFQSRTEDSSFKALFSSEEWADLISFEGNANALRILTRAFRGRMQGGFRLTFSTLGAILKYPCSSTAMEGRSGPIHRKKYGYFQSDQAVFQSIVEKLGMEKDSAVPDSFHRHPFVYLVEAADDICYSIMDLEDAHRLGIFPTQKVANLLLQVIKAGSGSEAEKIERTYFALSDDANEGINYLRAKAINQLIRRCASIFLENGNAILSGKFPGDLLSHATELKAPLAQIQEDSVRNIYNHPSVVRIELAGYNIMHGLVGDLVEAALLEPSKRDSMARKRISLIPDQYVFEEADSPYEKVMCILDFVSGMTDSYALKLYRNLRGIEIPSI